MLLYKSQPKTAIVNNIVNLNAKRQLLDTLQEELLKFRGKKYDAQTLTSLVTDASIIDAALVLGGYENILVVTSFNESEYKRLRDYRYRAIKSAGDHLLPIIHKMNNSHGNMTVTYSKFFDSLYSKYDINVSKSDEFRIDGDFRIRSQDKFDAVVLLGCESSVKGKYQSEKVKAKFARYCTDNFHLIDIYRNDFRKINGRSKDITNVKNRIVNIVNTPKVIFQGKKLVDVPNKTKDQLTYERLVDNITNLQNYYRVY